MPILAHLISFDNSRIALYHPERLEAFPNHSGVPKFDPRATSWSLANGWWMANFAHLAYSEADAVAETLARIGMRLRRFYRNRNLAPRSQSTEGYLAENDRFAVVAFRGTQPGDIGDIKADADARLDVIQGDIRAHRGFCKALDEVWETVAADIEDLRRCEKPVWVTGHSLGAALATLTALRTSIEGGFTFGSPRVGNEKLAAALSEVPLFRVVLCSDIVTQVPPGHYRHAGEMHFFDHQGKHFVEPGGWAVWKARVRGEVRYHVEGHSLTAGNVLIRCFADHAIINYRRVLERQLENEPR